MRLIDADALKEKRFRMHSEFLGTVTVVSERDIDNAPTIDAEPVKHGRWIMRGGKLYCSACQQRAGVARDSDDFWYTKGTTCCPNCGVKMEVDNG